ncbi:hypothetical protein [Nocardia abscessus]|uniref:hypothetical protein n=1 Tax=Nocardia abscessus TaxID=120957 RepID=UPI000684D2C5|nr:hypothetical protein [Nocardia abscessus]MCC3329830.1 hypothetical protein [Nocardia abscessus]
MATVLKMLLAERHLKSHPDFLVAYDRCAAQLDPPIPPGHGPAKAQYYQWLSGRMIGLPRDYHRRVLEKMFPGWTVEGLFQMANSTPDGTGSLGPGPSGTDVRLEAFLGVETTTRGTTLVYPSFELTRSSVDALRAAGISRRRIFGKQEGAFPDRPVDVPSVVAENDFRGLLYMFSMLQRHTSIRAEVRSDRYMVAHHDRPFISFGLSGNDCTRLYPRTVERPLFTIRDSGAEDDYTPVYLELADGSRYDSGDDRNISVIARVRPCPDQHPDRYWFFCGGLRPRGTAGAGWHLADSWLSLQHRVGDREFVAVIGVDEYSDRTTSLEHLLIA